MFFLLSLWQQRIFLTKKMKIFRITSSSAALFDALERLLPQLSSSATTPSAEHIEKLLSNENTHLFTAEIEGNIVGMLSLVVVDIPTGRKAWIEDVVVDEAARGLRIGAALVEHAKEEAKRLGVKKIYLTSNPSRKAAHALYHKCGFEEYDTSVFCIIM